MKMLNRILPWILVVTLLCALVPSVLHRIEIENQNKNVVISALYKDFELVLSEADKETYLKKLQKAGATTVSIMEEDLNSLVADGRITNIKYNVLLHKYDEESMLLAEELDKNPNVVNDSYVVITKREESKEILAKWFPQRYTEDEYCHITSGDNDVYCIYNGTPNTWDVVMGYDEAQFEYVKNLGFDIAMMVKIKNYKTTEYLNEMDRLIKKYNIKYLNIKPDWIVHQNDEFIDKQVEGISKLIKDNNMTLVITENANQLSNQEPSGYDKIFEENYSKVVRSYETYDVQNDETKYMFRYHQYLNSTIDRNLKFITVTMIDFYDKNFPERADLTAKAVEEYVKKITELGYSVADINVDYSDYRSSIRYTGTLSAIILILMVLIMLRILCKSQLTKVSLVAYALALLSIPATYLLPKSIIGLYPTLCATILPCFAVTVVFFFVSKVKDKLNTVILAILSLIIMLATLVAGVTMLGAMLSGVEYYMNNLVFRGTKIALVFPLLYSIAAYYFMFMKKPGVSPIDEIVSILKAHILVYWIVIIGAFLIVASIYITRSGNVNSISAIEAWMRQAITDIFVARPRTKEFLIGYPSLVLFIYYIKNKDIKLVSFAFSVGTAILAASTVNTFCHVFTEISTMYMRVVNGILLGILVSIVAYVLNILIIKAVIKFNNRYKIF